MLRNSTLSAFRASDGVLESAAGRITRSITATHRRAFSYTARQNAGIAHFTPASTPELTKLLESIREKIILPSYIPPDQRRKIFSLKYEKKLQSDPITIEIDGEVIKFRYMNPFKEMPQTRRSVVSAVSQFTTDEDFANLRPLFEGIAYAKRKFGSDFYCKVLRTCGNKGKIYDVLDCARSVRRTGFKLDTSEKVNEALFHIQMKAFDSKWDEAETKRALRKAELVIELLQDEGHIPAKAEDRRMLDGELPLYRDPMTLLAPLHIAAGFVVNNGDSEDVGLMLEKATDYAKDVIRVWPEGKSLTAVQPEKAYEMDNKMKYLAEPNKFFALCTPLLHGLDMAIKVVEPELAKQLLSRRNQLTADLRAAKPDISWRGESAAEKFYGDVDTMITDLPEESQ